MEILAHHQNLPAGGNPPSPPFPFHRQFHSSTAALHHHHHQSRRRKPPPITPHHPPQTHHTPTAKMTSTIGIPIKLLNEAQGHIVTLEITSGQTYRGKLIEAEDNMNVQLKDITVTARDGRVSHLEQVYIRGSHVRFFIVPDMLRFVSPFPRRGCWG